MTQSPYQLGWTKVRVFIKREGDVLKTYTGTVVETTSTMLRVYFAQDVSPQHSEWFAINGKQVWCEMVKN